MLFDLRRIALRQRERNERDPFRNCDDRANSGFAVLVIRRANRYAESV